MRNALTLIRRQKREKKKFVEFADGSHRNLGLITLTNYLKSGTNEDRKTRQTNHIHRFEQAETRRLRAGLCHLNALQGDV